MAESTGISSRRIHLIVFEQGYKQKFRNLTKPRAGGWCLCGAAAVAANISSSCCTAGDRGPPKAQPRRQPIFSPPSSKLLRANAIPDRVQHQLYLPQTRSYLSRSARQREIRACETSRACFNDFSTLLFNQRIARLDAHAWPWITYFPSRRIYFFSSFLLFSFSPSMIHGE